MRDKQEIKSIKCLLDRMLVGITLAAFFIYIFLMLYFCMRIDALVPDERWFLKLANSLKGSSLSELIFTENMLGYGSFYWIILSLLENIMMMRIVSWLCMITVPICIGLTIKLAIKGTIRQICYAMIVYLCCPLSWFTGKIIGPELYGNALGAMGSMVLLIILSCKEKGKIFNGMLLFLGGGG